MSEYTGPFAVCWQPPLPAGAVENTHHPLGQWASLRSGPVQKNARVDFWSQSSPGRQRCTRTFQDRKNVLEMFDDAQLILYINYNEYYIVLIN